MTAGLKPYPEMRDSGVEWLGDVGLFSKGNGGTKADQTEVGVPCVRYGDLYTQHHFHITASKACVAHDRAGAYTPIQYGDVLFAASGETLEEIGKSAVNLIDGSACCGGDVIVFRPTIEVDAEFIGWGTDFRLAAAQKGRMGRGITVMHIYSKQLKHLIVPLPPLPEQTAIARFLNHADRRIRRYIRAKERLIALLEEQKRAVIHEPVTGRVDVRTGKPYPAYRDSGVEWLGKVPEHWEVRRLKTVSQISVSNVDKHSRTDELPVRLCNYVDVYKNERVHENLSFMRATASPQEITRFRLVSGDVLITKDSEDWQDIGVPALVEHDADDLVCGYHIAILRPVTAIIGHYLLRVLQCTRIAWQFQVAAAGVTRYGLTHNAIRSARIPLPPLPEQTAIARYLNKATATVDRTIDLTRRQIALAEEYRTRLISDVVTGKLDVRAAAAELPEVDPVAVGSRGATIHAPSNSRTARCGIAEEASP